MKPILPQLILVCALLLTPSALAQVRHPQSKVTQAIGPRGGVLMLPLTAERHGDRWPSTLELRTHDNQALTGHVAWIHSAPRTGTRNWTDDPRDLLIRAIQPSDDSSPTALAGDPVMGPYLLVRLPETGEGPLRLGRQTINLTWLDVPGARLPRADDPPRTQSERPILPLRPSPDRPDPVSPFEYWRWVLLADEMDMHPPVPFGGEVERLAAEHFAALWRIGLDRLARQSHRIAEQARDMLTKTGIDRRQPFAAWVIDPVQVSALLTILIDLNRADTTVLSQAVAWIDSQPPLFMWPECEFGDQVRLAMITPRNEPMVARFRWRGSDEPPVAVRIEPGVLMQVSIDRAPVPRPAIIGMAPPPEPAQQVLEIQVAGQQYEFVFGPRVLEAKPPGVFFRPLLPPATLADVQAARHRLAPEEQSTFVQVRRLNNRWEAFFECRRPGGAAGSTGSLAALPEFLRSFDDLGGIEAVTLALGPEDLPHGATHGHGPVVRLTIPETGFWRLYEGENDGTLQVHRQSYGDRWYCRIVLPETWFSAAETSPGLLGFVRSHGDSAQLETGPNASLPWRPAPTRAAIMLEAWDDLPLE